VIVASGDDGVGKDSHSFSNDGSKTSRWLPFPASCPFVTSVGATRLFNPEIIGFDKRDGSVTGGSFSSYFSRPKYQDKAVSAYAQSLGAQFVGDGLYNKNDN
jgi:tripeptidyl-peptidase-1